MVYTVNYSETLTVSTNLVIALVITGLRFGKNTLVKSIELSDCVLRNSFGNLKPIDYIKLVVNSNNNELVASSLPYSYLYPGASLSPKALTYGGDPKSKKIISECDILMMADSDDITFHVWAYASFSPGDVLEFVIHSVFFPNYQ